MMMNQTIKPILDLYPLHIQDIVCLDPMDENNHWLLQTDSGPKIIKKVPVKPKRMVFLIEAHLHLLNNGFPITPIQITKNNGLCVSTPHDSYVMYDQQVGNEFSYYHAEHLIKVMKTIGDFHIASKGFQPHKKSKKRNRLGKYHKLYQWNIQELAGNKMLAEANREDPFSKLFLEHVDGMIERAKQSLAALDEKPYQQWTEQFRSEGGFCQQNFKLSHFIDCDGKPFMTDLPSITIDLPTRDLRIFLNKVMLKLGVWDTQLALRMLQSYEQAHSLTEDHYNVLWTDLRFPYHFCALVHQYYLQQNPSWTSEQYMQELQLIIGMELSKTAFLQEHSDYVAHIKTIGGNKP